MKILRVFSRGSLFLSLHSNLCLSQLPVESTAQLHALSAFYRMFRLKETTDTRLTSPNFLLNLCFIILYYFDNFMMLFNKYTLYSVFRQPLSIAKIEQLDFVSKSCAL